MRHAKPPEALEETNDAEYEGMVSLDVWGSGRYCVTSHITPDVSLSHPLYSE
jgi:hypothetical protein